MEHLDKTDIQLIKLLQENARYSLKMLSEKVNLSTPAVSTRIDKLQTMGIIKGYTAIVDQLKLGFIITAFINLEVPPKGKPEFYEYIETCPNVLECNCVTGNYSMLIKVAFKNTIELDTFIGILQKNTAEELRTSFHMIFPGPEKKHSIGRICSHNSYSNMV